LKPFVADLSDLHTIKPAVEAFLAEEYRLDVLFLNAGVMTPPPNSKTLNGYDLELGVHCLASFLLVSLFQPTMGNVASHFCHPNQSIRVVWVSSLLNLSTPQGGVQLDTNGSPKQLKSMENYMQSKAGVYLLAHEFSSRQKQEPSSAGAKSTAKNEISHGNPFGVLHVTLNPGFIKTDLQRTTPAPLRAVMSAMFKGPQFGAYTELYAGIAPNVKDGDFIIPWGRKGEVPAHIVESTRAVGEMESVSKRFYDWCERQVKPYL
jgi:NAD(P)-dependent dehydrogenase (short-subunit alcohol dehydrogenase family)